MKINTKPYVIFCIHQFPTWDKKEQVTIARKLGRKKNIEKKWAAVDVRIVIYFNFSINRWHDIQEPIKK